MSRAWQIESMKGRYAYRHQPWFWKVSRLPQIPSELRSEATHMKKRGTIIRRTSDVAAKAHRLIYLPSLNVTFVFKENKLARWMYLGPRDSTDTFLFKKKKYRGVESIWLLGTADLRSSGVYPYTDKAHSVVTCLSYSQYFSSNLFKLILVLLSPLQLFKI